MRVDLVGGTLDLVPINLILAPAYTLNLATGLKAKVRIEESNSGALTIVSKDYEATRTFNIDELWESDDYQELSFVVQIIRLFNPKEGLKVTLESGAPAGSGLGGSSAMGVTLYKGLCKYFARPYDPRKTIKTVNAVEGRILDRGVAGYQDYFPALYGGILALLGTEEEIELTQLYGPKLKEFLERRIVLVFSGISRNSGINNWQVYKDFFDREGTSRQGLSEIAQISLEFYSALTAKRYEEALELIVKEGELRTKLAKEIVPDPLSKLVENAPKSLMGIKMCGAGGGGCFIAIAQEGGLQEVRDFFHSHQMTCLPFEIDPPLESV